MKEKREIRRSLFSLLLALALVVTILPVSNLTAYAEDTVEPLTFTALEDDCSISFSYKAGTNVMYKLGNGQWTSYTEGESIDLANTNDTVSFKGENIQTSGQKHFAMEGKMAASGQVTSLTNGDGGDVALTDSCYSNMFFGCDTLVTAPELPSTRLANYCYFYMFGCCYNLVNAPALPATTVEMGSYRYMFYMCSNLVNAPDLPATNLAYGCYFGMFHGCESMITAPALPATTLADYCYYCMFYECTNLVYAPALPATTVTEGCYHGLFCRCKAMKVAPDLPATTLAEDCYGFMFQECTSLESIPDLPATNLPENCYWAMFWGCSALKISTECDDEHQFAWSIPAEATEASSWHFGMFDGCGENVCFCTGTTLEKGATYYQYGVSVTGVSLDLNTLSLEVNKNARLKATVVPENAKDKSVKWSSDNENVAKVDSEGTITAISAGTANITVTTVSGNKTASCAVTVNEVSDKVVTTPAVNNSIEVEEETLFFDPNIDSREDELSPFSCLQLKLSTNVTKGKVKATLKWKSVEDADGYIIYSAKCGKILSRVATVDASKTSWSQSKLKKNTYYKYLVVAYKGDSVLCTSKTVHGIAGSKKYSNPVKIKGLKKSLTVKVGKSSKLKGKVTCKKKIKKHVAALRYESADTSIATVSKKGKVTGVSKGKTIIYVYAQNGLCKKVKVTVK